MRIRGLAVFPLLYAAVFVLLVGWLLDPGSVPPFIAAQRILVRLFAIAGCLAAVSAFASGDHLRRAWLAIATGTVLILSRDVLVLYPPAAFPSPDTHAGSLLLLNSLGLLCNGLILFGTWQLARSWKMAAMAMPGGRSGVALVALATVGIALAVAGPGALQNARQLAAGDWGALTLLISAIVDIVSLGLIAPLLLTALALRGGLFSWPWALLAACLVSWLLYDAASGPAPILSAGGFPVKEVFRGMAENFLAAAGLAQWLVIRQVHRRISGPR